MNFGDRITQAMNEDDYNNEKEGNKADEEILAQEKRREK